MLYNLLCFDLIIVSNAFKTDVLRKLLGLSNSMVDITVWNFSLDQIKLNNKPLLEITIHTFSVTQIVLMLPISRIDPSPCFYLSSKALK